MRRLAGFWTLAAIGVFVCSGDVCAHKLKVFATGEGEQITGYVYFPGGGRAQGLTVLALAPDGAECGTAVTGANGEFAIRVRLRCNYTLVAQTSDGHRAEFMVEAVDLSGDLPEREAVPAGEDHDLPDGASESKADDENLRAVVEQAVREQVRPLREQLEAYEEKVRARDVIGGIGYILGAAGIAFYFLGVRKRANASTEGR